MRVFSLLLLLFGPLLSAPAAAGLWTRAWLQDRPDADLYGLGAAAAVVALEAILVRRRGLVREVAILALSSFWAGWLWLALTDKGFDWKQPPAFRTPDSLERIALMLIVLVYLTFYAVAVHTRPQRLN
jgi:hypothetical protein